MRYAAAEPVHLEAIQQLLQECDLPCDDVREHLAGFIVALEEGQLVGVVGLERAGSVGLLRSLAVRASHRGRGLGHALHERVLARSAELELERLCLLTVTARGFFESRGFRVIQRSAAPEAIQQTAEFSRLCPVSAVLMDRPL